MGPEAQLQRRIIKDLKNSGWLVNKIITCTLTGWPDIFAMKKGPYGAELWFIEVKAKNKRPTPLQKYCHAQITLYGGEVHVVDSWEAYCQLKFLI